MLLAAGLLFTGGARAAGAELLWIDPALSSVEVDVQATFDSAAECPDFDRPAPAVAPGRSADTR